MFCFTQLIIAFAKSNQRDTTRGAAKPHLVSASFKKILAYELLSATRIAVYFYAGILAAPGCTVYKVCAHELVWSNRAACDWL